MVGVKQNRNLVLRGVKTSESEPGVVSEDLTFESDVVSGGSSLGLFPDSEPTLGDFFANLTADDLVDPVMLVLHEV